MVAYLFEDVNVLNVYCHCEGAAATEAISELRMKNLTLGLSRHSAELLTMTAKTPETKKAD
jgi:hypothetical protein